MLSALVVAASDPTRPMYLVVAFGAGVISFLSPCVLPIVPAYLSLITGLTVGDLKEGDTRVLPRIAIDTGLFIAGFTAVFVLLGLITTTLGDVLFQNQELLTRVSGALVILMALYLAGSQILTAPRVYQEFRFHPHLERFGPLATPIAGAAFGLGWTPCIGPVLGAVLSFAAQGQSVPRATLLLVAYSCGLGLSFLAVGLAFGKLTAPLDWVKRHSRSITFLSAGVLFFFGVVLLTDNMWRITAWLTDVMDQLGLNRLINLG